MLYKAEKIVGRLCCSRRFAFQFSVCVHKHKVCKFCVSWQCHLVFQAGLEEKVLIGCTCSTETSHPEKCKSPSLEVCKTSYGWTEPWLTSLVPMTVLLYMTSQTRDLCQSILKHFCVSVQSIRQPYVRHAVRSYVSCITAAERVTSVFGTAAGIVTRCPLELKLKRIPATQEWKGKIHYHNFNIELHNASEVDNAIRQGEL